MGTNKSLIVFLLLCVSAALSATTAPTQINVLPLSYTQPPVNLNIDILDDHIPVYLKNALSKATFSKNLWLHQYTEEYGYERLRRAIASLYSKRINQRVNPKGGVVITVGASEALYSTFQALTTAPGDEWIIIEPFWSKFLSIVEAAKAVARFTNLKLIKRSYTLNGNDYVLDRKELASLFNNRTRGILLNNPNNPSGKVYTLEDLQFIAGLSKQHNTLVVSDEAHEYVVYPPYKHISIASLPGMFERTVTIGSASKSFGVSGWRIGWVYGPSKLIRKINDVHEVIVQSSPTPAQDALAHALELEYQTLGTPMSFLSNNLVSTAEKRDYFVAALRKAGLLPVVPNGGHCMIVHLPELKGELKFVSTSDYVDKIIGVSGIGMDHYYGKEHARLGKQSVRYCFQKNTHTLIQAAMNFQRFKDRNMIRYDATYRYKVL